MVKDEAALDWKVSTADANEEPRNKKIASESKTDDLGEVVDRISNLPQPITHHIMSFLPTKDAARSSVLSKRWRYLWVSFPILDFDQSDFEMDLSQSVDAFKIQDLFLTYLENYIQHRESVVKIDKFRLRAEVFLQADSRINSVIDWALEHGVKQLDLDLINQNCLPYNWPNSLCPKESVTSLKLGTFNLDLHDLLLVFPSLQELVLRGCKVLKDIECLGANLKTLALDECEGFRSIKIESCNLQSFLYYANPHNQGTVTLIACTFLKVLSLRNVGIEDKWLEHHISELVHLEDLTLDCCFELRVVNLFHGKLKRLSLLRCKKFVEVGIDCPKLYCFTYAGEIVTFGSLNSSSHLNATLILSRNQTKGWFVKLRRLLSLFDHCKVLSLVCKSYQDLIIPEYGKDDFLPPLHDLKHLKVECHSTIEDYIKLVDDLLWFSPHLETLSIVSMVVESGREVVNSLDAPNHKTGDPDVMEPSYCKKKLDFKFQYKKLLAEDEDSFCCVMHPKECWQHRLKKVMINSFDGSVHDDKKNLLKYFSENGKILESIQNDSQVFGVLQGKYFEQSTILS
ncbi:F-box protein At1g60400 isoform X1 [Diospyros lotus]|uniref:F-box protein At1g60400 isoform X1 n=1 Tax=Diospyros lotus TaxID=55363 RepID=UPI0022571B5C|nr:F-box protein At1g60400 isoform X1 [Diospyros lotus]XP_052178166.1 F-box protein At1g60400 isoform X1 [Diospyros lotus]